jgi:glycosyltransferase involved in cell wall biosynthesis
MIHEIKRSELSAQRPVEEDSALELSIVIPVYNESESLKILHEKIVTTMQAQALTWEVIYVDDGSRDGSTALLRTIQEADPHATVAVQRRNFGKSAALAVGFSLARGEILLTMDADLQDEPDEIPNLLAALHDGYDVAVGFRQKRIDPLSKRVPSWVANNMTRLLTGLDIHDMNSGLKAYSRECIERISLYGDMHRYIPILAHFAGFRIIEVPVVHHPRQFGRSKYSGGRFIRGGLDLVTVLFLNRYSRRPLHLFGLLGSLLLAAGLIIDIILSIDWFQGQRPIGDRPALLLGTLLILVGVQILSLGLLAEMFVAFVQKNESPMNTVTKIYERDGKSTR